MDIKWGKQRREAFAKKESKLLVTAKGLEVSLHLFWDCLCRVASGLVAATFSSWAPCVLLRVSVVSCLVTALMSVRYRLCLHLLWGAREEFQLGLKQKERNAVLFPAGIAMCSGMQSWLHAGWVAQQQQVPTGLCLASVTTPAAVLEKVLIWLLQVFTQDVLVMLLVFLKILYLSRQTISLGSLQIVCTKLVPAEAGDKVSVKDLCLPFSTEIDTVPLFPLLHLFFCIENFLILILFFPWCFKRGRSKIRISPEK